MKIALDAQSRVKETAFKLRRTGWVPGIVYGAGLPEALAIKVERKAFQSAFKSAGETQVIELKVGDKTVSVLLHDYQRDPMTNAVIHVDFLAISKDKRFKIDVPLKFTGVAPAVKNLGGVLITNLRELEIEAVPGSLPAFLEVSLASLVNYHDEILAQDVKMPEGAKVMNEPHVSIVAVLPPRTQAELESLSGVVEEKVEEVGADKVGKAEEAEGEAAAGAAPGAKPAAGVKPAAPAPKAAPAKGAAK